MARRSTRTSVRGTRGNRLSGSTPRYHGDSLRDFLISSFDPARYSAVNRPPTTDHQQRAQFMPSSAQPTHDEVQAVEQLANDYRRMRTEIGKVIIGQETVVEQLLTALFARGHVLLVGVPGLAKTLLVSTVARILSLSFRRIQFTPDMMPSDITGTDILQDDPETGRRRFAFIARPGVRQHDPGRRDQPHASQDAGGPARSDAGAACHGGRAHLSAARPVLRAGDAEPDRAGRHVSAARGAARPLHAQRPGAVPDARGRAGDPPRHHRRRGARARGDALRRADPGLAAPGAAGAGGRSRVHLRPRPDPRQPADGAGGDGLRQALRLVGCRPARRAVADRLRQGVRRAARPLCRGHRRRAARRPAGAAAPDRHHLPRRGRGRRSRRRHRPPAGRRLRAPERAAAKLSWS